MRHVSSSISRVTMLTLASAVVITSCRGSESVETTDSAAPWSPESTFATITQPDPRQLGGVLMSETLEPMGSVVSGIAGPAYIDDTYPTELAGIVRFAIIDLSEKLAVDLLTITVVLVEEVVWTDASLGCPQPDVSYAQVLTDGLRIILEASGLLYDYRSGGFSDPILCVQALDKDKTRAGIFQLTEDGEIVYVTPNDDGGEPTESVDPPDE